MVCIRSGHIPYLLQKTYCGARAVLAKLLVLSGRRKNNTRAWVEVTNLCFCHPTPTVRSKHPAHARGVQLVEVY